MLLEYLGAMLSLFGGGRLGNALWQGEDALQIKNHFSSTPFNSPAPKESFGPAGDTGHLSKSPKRNNFPCYLNN